jgi:hypothetical protein
MTRTSIPPQFPARGRVDAWGARSKVVDTDGRLKAVFRGQHGPADHWSESQIGSLSFGSARAASVYAEKPNNREHVVLAPKVFPVYLDIQTPFLNCPTDPFMDFSHYADVFGIEEAKRLAVKFQDYVLSTDTWHAVSGDIKSVEELTVTRPDLLLELCMLLYPVLDDADEVARLVAHGFDGAIHAGSGWASAHEPEYRVFSVEQVRSVWDTCFSPE